METGRPLAAEKSKPQAITGSEAIASDTGERPSRAIPDSDAPLILAVETSGPTAGVALLDGNSDAAVTRGSAESRRHARSLVKDVDAALRGMNRGPRDVGLVAVSVGPGSFTGLRVGVVFAKTWCYATGASLVAVDTLLAAAANSPVTVRHVYAVADAQRGELFVGEYRRDDRGEFVRIGEVEIVAAVEFAAARAAADFVTGPGLERFAALFEDRCRTADPSQRRPTAAGVAKLGRRLAESGEFTDFWRLEPFYLRKSAAEEKWDARNTCPTE
jgi:tRNA threonylcarbamoyladenosine biosynthesis protein TsaB